MSLKKELKEFVVVFTQHENNCGSVTYSDDISTEIDDLEIFFSTLVFDELLTVGGLMSVNIETKVKLMDAQLGWYKIRDEQGNEVNDDQNWNKDWIVFADRNGDAIYYNRLDKSVNGSIDKVVHLKLAQTLEDFIKTLQMCMRLEQEKYDMNAQGENEEPLKEFIDDIQHILNEGGNQEKVSEDFMQFFFG